jgi:hypothetical protein
MSEVAVSMSRERSIDRSAGRHSAGRSRLAIVDSWVAVCATVLFSNGKGEMAGRQCEIGDRALDAECRQCVSGQHGIGGISKAPAESDGMSFSAHSLARVMGIKAQEESRNGVSSRTVEESKSSPAQPRSRLLPERPANVAAWRAETKTDLQERWSSSLQG